MEKLIQRIKHAGICALLLGSIYPAAHGLPPVIFYSDLTSGPNTGGENNKGALVTVAGKNFGSSRKTGYVAVGGGRADNYPLWSDTRITFQMGAGARTGDITVTTAEGTSNGIAFTVRSGNIYFVSASSPRDPGSGTFRDPWRSPGSYFAAMRPGDICYFREGTYSGQYGSTKRPYNVSFYRTGAPAGFFNNEIAWVGYPGEVALFRADDRTVHNGAFEFLEGAEYYVVAGLSMYSRGDGRGALRIFSNNNKVANCRVEGIKTLCYGMFEVTATAGTRIWGNECFGATSGNKLDHILYCQSGADNVDFGWNYLHDNDIGAGPAISINEDGGHAKGSAFRNIVIHDNIIDCRSPSGSSRAIGVHDAASGTSLSVYNNVIIEGGSNVNYYHCMYFNAGSVYLYNNTFYRTKGNNSYAIYLNDASSDWHPENVEIKNNIFYNQPGCGYIGVRSKRASITIANNCYFGSRSDPPGQDSKPVNADPLFVNGPASDFHLRSGSPCIGTGTDTAGLAPKDYDGNVRLPGRIDLGAFPPSSGKKITHK